MNAQTPESKGKDSTLHQLNSATFMQNDPESIRHVCASKTMRYSTHNPILRTL